MGFRLSKNAYWVNLLSVSECRIGLVVRSVCAVNSLSVRSADGGEMRPVRQPNPRGLELKAKALAFGQ